jgi:hypothetical protein
MRGSRSFPNCKSSSWIACGPRNRSVLETLGTNPLPTTKAPARADIQEALGGVLQFRSRLASVRHFSSSETHGYVLFPNVVHGRVVDLQGRAYPTPARRNAYLNRPVCVDHIVIDT